MAIVNEIKDEIPIPEGIEVIQDQATFIFKGEKGELTRTFSHPKINVQKQNNSISIVCKNPRRKQKALVGTFHAHIHNMIKGVTQGFEYQMKTVFSHFPIKTSVEGNTFIIENFLGERCPRKALILDGVTVVVKGEAVTVSGIDKEKVGQTTANIERATKVSRRDIRVFQDGVYRISRGG